MGTAKEQGDLWGARAADWARAGEPAWHDVFAAVLDHAQIEPGMRCLDIGCGAGGALVMARQRGTVVSGLDAAANLLAIARTRLPGADIRQGDMEALPFADRSFERVIGINSFQFAGDQRRAFAEAARVTRPGGSVTMLVWGSREKSELLAKVMPEIFALLPPSPQSRPLAETAEGLMSHAGLVPEATTDLKAALRYVNCETAVRAILAASERAIRHAGEATVKNKIERALSPFVAGDGSVSLVNLFRLVRARRPG